MIKIYTDGACSGNPGKGGYGVVLRYGEHYKELSGGYRMTTNNRMELIAVIKGLEALNKPNQNVLIVSDSKYVIDSVDKKWVFGWENNNFKGKKNADLWKIFLTLYNKHTVTFEWIKGHNLHPENEKCDKLAVKARGDKNLNIDKVFESL